MKVANGALVADFFILVLMIFRLKFLAKKCFKMVVFPRSGFGAAIYAFATQSLQIAVEWLRQGFSLLRVGA